MSPAELIWLIVEVFTIAIFLRAIVSWFAVDPRNSLVIFLYQITEPILAPLRRIIPPLGGTIDITPMVAIVLLQVIGALLANAAT